MSVNLTLVVDRYGRPDELIAYTRLALDVEDDALFSQLRDAATPLQRAFQWYDQDGLERCSTDAYNEPLTWLPAYQAARHLDGHVRTPWDVAVLVFLQNLPLDTSIVLWWH